MTIGDIVLHIFCRVNDSLPNIPTDVDPCKMSIAEFSL